MEETFQDPESFSKGFQVMNEARKERLFCDVVLKSGLKTFHCHRVVLAGMIPYFYSMFTMDMLENKEGLIEIKDTDSEALKSLIEFAYSGVIKINLSNVQSLLITSSYLQMNSVRDACSNYLIQRLDVNNALELKCLAETIFCKDLLDVSTHFIDREFLEIKETHDFINLSSQQLIEIIQRDQLCVSCEVDVYESVMKWLKHDVTRRQQFLDELLCHVRMSLIPLKYLNDKVSTDFKRLSHCSNALLEATTYHSKQRSDCTKHYNKGATPRISSGSLYVVGGLDDKNKFLSSVEVFCPTTDSWQFCESMPTARSNFAIAVHYNRMYIIGGLYCNGADKMTSLVEVYNPYNESWRTVSSLHEPKSSLKSCIHENSIYVCGGLNTSNDSLNVVEYYCHELDTWEIVTPMIVQRAEGGLVSLHGCLWALGGCDGYSWLSSVESYDPRTSSWEFQTAMPSSRCGFGVTTLNDRIYVCGGEDERSLEEFDPRNKCWRSLSSMNMERWGMSLVPSMGKLWAIGGRDILSKLDSVEVYDPKLNSWYFAPPMSTNRSYLGAVTLLHT